MSLIPTSELVRAGLQETPQKSVFHTMVADQSINKEESITKIDHTDEFEKPSARRTEENTNVEM